MSSKKRKGISGKSDTAPLRVGGGGGGGIGWAEAPHFIKDIFFRRFF